MNRRRSHDARRAGDLKPATRTRPVIAALSLLTVIVTACGSSTSSSTPGPASGQSGGAPTLSGSITVFAAASLTEAFKDAEKTLEQRHPGFVATYSFAGSQQLVTNINNGAPADVIATADMKTPQAINDKRLTVGIAHPVDELAGRRIVGIDVAISKITDQQRTGERAEGRRRHGHPPG